MTARTGLVTIAVVASSLSLPLAAHADSAVNLGLNGQGQSINVSASTGSVASNDSLVNVSGNAVNVNPAVGVNVLSNGSTTVSTGTNNGSGSNGGVLGASTGNGIASGNGLVNVSGNAVNVNPAVCANVLSNGNCQATTTTNNGGGSSNTGGGVLGASTTSGLLPRTGMASFLAIVLSLVGSAGSAALAHKRQLV